MPGASHITLVLLLIGILPLCAEGQLTLSVAEVDSLRCPPRDSTLQYLHGRLAFDTTLRSQRLQLLLGAYARLTELAEELTIRRRLHQNLQLVQRVLTEQQRRAEVSDLDVLASQGRLLESELAIADCTLRIRQTILEIAELAFIQITLTTPSASSEQPTDLAKNGGPQ